MHKIFLLVAGFIASTNVFAQGIGIKALSPYDVVVPSLNSDPAANARVVGQMYYNVTGTGSFRAVDKNGNISTFNTSGATISGVTAGTGLLGGGTTGSVNLAVDVGTSPNQIVQLDSTGKLPAVDGSQLTNLPSSSGANTSLSNLTTTSVNKSLHFSLAAIEAGDIVNITGPDRPGDTGMHMTIKVGTSGFNPGTLSLISGNNGVGTILIKGQSVVQGLLAIQDGSQGTVGHVWASTGVNGEGSWQLAPYAAGAPGDWANPAPTTVAEALDRLAALAKALNGGTPVP